MQDWKAKSFIANLVNNPSDTPYSAAQITDFEANPLKYQEMMFQQGVTNGTQLSVSGVTDDEVKHFLS